MTLGDFLKQQATLSGPWNCSTFPADWCLTLGYPDFAAPWRRHTETTECETVACAAGGLVNLWRQGIGEGLPPAHPPYQTGDIAVVSRCALEAGAIFGERRWILRVPGGFTSLPLPDSAIVEAWRP